MCNPWHADWAHCIRGVRVLQQSPMSINDLIDVGSYHRRRLAYIDKYWDIHKNNIVRMMQSEGEFLKLSLPIFCAQILMSEIFGVISSSTSSRIRTVSSEVKIVTPFSMAQRRMIAPSA